MKLTKGKKLKVFFGCAYIEDEKTGKSDEIRELEYEDTQKETLALRTRIIEGLNKSREVRDVSDLFAKLPPDFLFNPIIFKMHIPLSLQKMRYVRDESIRAEVEDFEVIYDSSILMVVALCDLDKIPFGVFDVRDRLEKVFDPIVKVKTVPPCLSPVAVTFLIEGDSENIGWETLLVHVPKPTESKVLLRKLYMEMCNDLDSFYEACSLAQDIYEEIEEIKRCESRLLGNLRDFLKADWKQIRKKWNLVSQSKKEMAKILEKVSDYTSSINLLGRKRKDIDTFIIQRNTSSAELIKKIGLDFYTESYSILDTSSVIKTVEHVRSEIETFSLNTSTLFSALLGAVVGSIITLMASGLL